MMTINILHSIRRMRRIHLGKVLMVIIVLLAAVSADLMGQSQVVIEYGADEELTKLLEQKSTKLLEAVNVWQKEGTDIFPDEQGVPALKKLVEEHNLISPYDTLGTGIIRNSDRFEIPHIYLQKAGESKHGFLEVTFLFSEEAQLADVRISGNEQNFDRIISRNIRIDGEQQKVYLNAFLDAYRKAFEEKNIDQVRTLFNEDSYIITGKRSTDFTGFLYHRDIFQEYLLRMKEEILTPENKVQVIFTDPVFYRHPDYKNIFGITVRQIWHSDKYSDAGSLFFIVDGRSGKPEIIARKWQETSFKANRYSFDQPQPLQAGLRLSDVHIEESFGLNQGSIILALNSETESLNAAEVRTWLQDDFLKFETIRVDSEQVQQQDKNVLILPFSVQNPKYAQQITSTVTLSPTAQLNGFSQNLTLYPGRVNYVEFFIGEDYSQQELNLAGNLNIQANTDSIKLSVSTLRGEGIQESILEDSTISLSLLEDNYRLTFYKPGYNQLTTEITLQRSEKENLLVEMEKVIKESAVVTDEKKTFFTKRRMWLIGGITAITTGAAILLTGNSGTDGPGIPIPPGRPGFNQ